MEREICRCLKNENERERVLGVQKRKTMMANGRHPCVRRNVKWIVVGQVGSVGEFFFQCLNLYLTCCCIKMTGPCWASQMGWAVWFLVIALCIQAIFC